LYDLRKKFEKWNVLSQKNERFPISKNENKITGTPHNSYCIDTRDIENLVWSQKKIGKKTMTCSISIKIEGSPISKTKT